MCSAPDRIRKGQGANALNRALCVVNATIQGRGVGGDDHIGPVKQKMYA